MNIHVLSSFKTMKSFKFLLDFNRHFHNNKVTLIKLLEACNVNFIVIIVPFVKRNIRENSDIKMIYVQCIEPEILSLKIV